MLVFLIYLIEKKRSLFVSKLVLIEKGGNNIPETPFFLDSSWKCILSLFLYSF